MTVWRALQVVGGIAWLVTAVFWALGGPILSWLAVIAALSTGAFLLHECAR